MKKIAAIVLLAFALVSCGKSAPSNHTAQPRTELSYAEYYNEVVPQVNGHASFPPCEFIKHTYIDKSNPDRPFTNFFFLCPNGKNPTIQQQQFWVQFVLASDCDAGRVLACDAYPDN